MILGVSMVNRHSLMGILCLVMAIMLASSVFAVTTFTAQETEHLTLSVDTFDFDEDEITYTFSEPFDDNGEWLTDYDDAGEYTVEITASDGVETDTKYVMVIVEETNREPYLSENSLVFYEQEEIDLTEYLVDPDQDVLIYSFSEPFSTEGFWTPSYDDAGRYVVEVEATDGEFTISRLMEIVIEETNQPPVIDETFSDDSAIYVAEGETLDFWVIADDEDEGDMVTATWNFDDLGEATGNSGYLEFNYFTEGEYDFSVTITDGEFEVTKSWTIIVENTNRAPEFDETTYYFEAIEGDKVTLDLPGTDQDGDELTYTFSEPFDENGEWVIDYDSEGSHGVIITASDGEYETELIVYFGIAGTDRAPSIDYSLNQIEYSEGDVFELDLILNDLDGDDLTVELLEAPADLELVAFATGEGLYSFEWEISYDTIQRSVNPITNTLNALRLERALLQEKTEVVEFEVCGSDLCTTESFTLTIANTNRAPEFSEIYNQSVTELDLVEPYVLATDADNDIIKYYFSEPLDKDGQWQTSYEDEGDYYVTITASDGYLTTSETILVEVAKLNREPTIWSEEDSFNVLEGEELSFWVTAEDEDLEDELTITLTSGPQDANFSEQIFTWTPDYGQVQEANWGMWNKLISGSEFLTKAFSSDETSVWLQFTVTDGEVEVILPVELVIKNVNQAPEIVSTTPSEVQNEIDVGVEMEFSVVAEDLDGDELEYKWGFSGFDYDKVTGTNSITRTFTSGGEKKVTVQVSDALETVEYSWIIDATGELTSSSSGGSSSSSSGGSGSSSTTTIVEDDSEPTYAVYTVEDWK